VSAHQQPSKPVAYVSPLMETVDFGKVSPTGVNLDLSQEVTIVTIDFIFKAKLN